jgi:hypothetical protein
MSGIMGPIEAGIIERYALAQKRLRMPCAMPAAPVHVRPRDLSPYSRQRASTPSAYFVNLLTPPSWRVIAGLVGLKHGFRIDQMRTAERSRPFVAARDEAMQLLATHTNMSLPEIGRRFNRDHTSVLHSLRKVGVGTRGQRGAHWTNEMDRDLIRLWAELASLTDISFVIGVSRNSVIARVVKLGLPRRDGKARARQPKRVAA